jgi:HEPN domain-containing protein
MSGESTHWVVFADENLAVARLALEGGYFNACLQNAQQAVEKYLKAALLAKDVGFQKTHSVETLNRRLLESDVQTGLLEEDCDLLDTIYVPSKYPVGSVLPDFNPDYETCNRCVELAERVRHAIQQIV